MSSSSGHGQKGRPGKQRPAFVLASQSPQRLTLLKRLNFPPDEVISPDIDESAFGGETPPRLAMRLAEIKAQTVSSKRKNRVILAADTVVYCGRRLLPKATGKQEVRSCLRFLSGRRHRVSTGLCLITPEGNLHRRITTTILRFKRLSEQEIDAYTDSNEGYNKAGGYAIQGQAEAFIPWIRGSYSNIVGLPLYETACLLKGIFSPWENNSMPETTAKK